MWLLPTYVYGCCLHIWLLPTYVVAVYIYSWCRHSLSIKCHTPGRHVLTTDLFVATPCVAIGAAASGVCQLCHWQLLMQRVVAGGTAGASGQ
jgi:hypothetical protein